MKRLAFHAMLVAAAMVGLIDLARNFETVAPSPPPPTYDCPMEFSPQLVEILKTARRAKHIPNKWTVAALGREQNEPEIEVGTSTIAPSPGTGGSCELRIRRAPQSPGPAVDWRVGYVVRGVDVLRGRTVTFRVKLRASRPTAFDSAMIYIHDGVGVSAAGFGLVSTQWQEVSVERLIDPMATVLEVWIRLVFDKGTIRPTGGSLYASSSVSLGF